MGILNFFRNLFEESEEELKADIKEAEKLKKDAEKKLRQLKKRKPVPLKYEVLFIVSIIVIALAAFGVYKYNTTFHFRCDTKNPCKDCDAVIHCLQFEETGTNMHHAHFILENKEGVERECFVDVSVKKGDLLVYSKTAELGIIPAQKQARFKLKLEVPDGDTAIQMKPTCN